MEESRIDLEQNPLDLAGSPSVLVGSGSHVDAPGALGGRRVLTRMLAFARREPILLGILGFAAIFFAYQWTINLSRPGMTSPAGWRGFNDQGFYLREALDLVRQGKIPSADFAFGPGYPLLATPFAAIGAHGWPFQDPFAIADLLIWCFTIGVTYLVGRRLGGEMHGVASAGCVMLATPLIGLTTLPWNTTALLGGGMLVLAVALSRRLRWWHGLFLGLAVGLAYSARYVDALWVGMEVLAVLYARGVLSQRGWPVLVTAVGAALILLLPTLWLQQQAFGSPFTTTYEHLNSINGTSFDVSKIGLHALDTFVSPFLFPEDGLRAEVPPLLSSMFLIALVPVGYWLDLRRSSGSRRKLVVGFGLAALAANLFYLAFYGTGPYGLGFGGIRFFEMWIPLWTLAGVTAVIEGVRALQSIALKGSRRSTVP